MIKEHGCYSPHSVALTAFNTSCRINIYVGNGIIGRARLAGKGGFHGTVRNDGDNGANGKGGSDGQSNVGNISDTLVAGQSQTESASISLPYAFLNEFFNLYLS